MSVDPGRVRVPVTSGLLAVGEAQAGSAPLGGAFEPILSSGQVYRGSVGFHVSASRVEPASSKAPTAIGMTWIRHLPPDDLRLFLCEVEAAAEESTSDADLRTRLDDLVHEWRDTAAIHADAELHELLSGPFNEDFGPVPDPRH